ncbi:APC family permease [Leucobacter massiliensis]|uniref:Amino acid permease n=1 Tax=Leucobacter massiliensis TaxID=1686285 RepID=A0A2S9QKQ0_9MICO|nr:APC family permease [Leucobacter massiliensis]PRI10167.1 amino acid permease [Leucobacter massiliensis]
MSAPATPDTAHHDPGLSRRTLGVPAITFMIIAASAPLTVVAGGVTTSFAVTESQGVPLGFLLIAVILTVFAVGYTAMSRHITNAGAFYAYIAQGLGRPLGVGASLVALVAYNAMQVGIYGLFGFQLSVFLEAKFGFASPWWVWILLCIVVVGVLGVNRVDLSAKVLGVLVALEFVVVIVFDIVAIGTAPEGVSTAAVNPAALFGPSLGIILVFGVAAFMGFEGAAIYGEEAKDPKRTVPRATYAAVAIIGVFYAFSAWAFSVGIGPSQIVEQSQASGPDLMFIFMTDRVGVIFADVMTLLFITSLFAALQAFHNAVARYFYSLGREGVLPAWFSRTSASGAPWAGSVAQTVIALVVVSGFAIVGDGLGAAERMLGETAFLYPVLTMFTWLTNTGAAALVLLMAVIAAAVIGFFRRDRRGLGVWTTVIAPAASGLALLWVFVMILANFQLMLSQAEPDATTFILPGLIFLAAIVGIVWALILRAAKQDIYRQIGHGTEPGAYGTELISVPEPR